MSDIGNQDTGGTLTLLAAIPSTVYKFEIRRFTPVTQEADLQNGSRLRAEIIENIGDKATMQIQETNVKIGEFMYTVEAEAHARQQADTALQDSITALKQENAALQTSLNEHKFLLEYLINFIEAKFGALSFTLPLITESGDYLITESGDFLVTA